ncbi:hypothetical protein KAOT1_06092 [Kordia algicida OT-1]|uniref:Uncharacterized protein n=1 Tax=Kordia algicida OT-1 TaxID=391587 RepID=A9EBK2_9FLAO|nr:hypothetical protein KAOT1_06092 [Kordia algicida OT-1]
MWQFENLKMYQLVSNNIQIYLINVFKIKDLAF